MREFILNPRLVTATLPVGDLPLCRVLLLNEQRYPWYLLVPRRPGIEEIVDLQAADRSVLMEEITWVSRAVKAEFNPFRLNIADIGNKAPQLHIHVVARNPNDEAWPAVVWSRPLVSFNADDKSRKWQQQMRNALTVTGQFIARSEHVDPGVERL